MLGRFDDWEVFPDGVAIFPSCSPSEAYSSVSSSVFGSATRNLSVELRSRLLAAEAATAATGAAAAAAAGAAATCTT